MRFVSLYLFFITSFKNDFFIPLMLPDISSPVYKPTQYPVRSCIGPGLISGILRYSMKKKDARMQDSLFGIIIKEN